MASYAPFLAPIAIVVAFGINFFTYWTNPWSVLPWAIGYGLVATSMVYFGLQREEKGLMLLGLSISILAVIVYAIPAPTQRPAVGRFVLMVTIYLACGLLWYRLSTGSWPLQRRFSNPDEVEP